MFLKKNPEVLVQKRYQFLKSHENVALGVLVGAFDAGAVKQEVFDEYKEKGLKSLALTPAVAEHLFVVSRKLDNNLLSSLRQALNKLKDSPAGREILSTIKPSITGFLPVSDADYDSLRFMIDALENENSIK